MNRNTGKAENDTDEMDDKASCSREDLEAALFTAVVKGDEDLVHVLLERHGAHPNLTNENGETALLLAVKTRNRQSVKVLLEHGADANVINSRGESALIEAIRTADSSVIEVLLQNGAQVDAGDAKAGTALCFAVRRHDKKATTLLLQHGADANKIDDRGCTALYIAANLCLKDVVKELIAHGANIDSVNHLGETALLAAAKNGSVKIVRSLLQYKPDVNAKDLYGNTALSFAIKSGKTELVQDLMRHGADANAGECWEDTPLFQAVKNGNKKIVNVLLQHGANADATDDNGNTALFHAVLSGNDTIMSVLLRHGASASFRSANGDTPLSHASSGRVVHALANAGADINARNNLGRTPYFYVSRNGTRNGKSYDGIIPLSMALLKYGAQLNTVDNFGITPAFFASLECFRNTDSTSTLAALWKSPEFEELELGVFMKNLRDFQLKALIADGSSDMTFVSAVLKMVRHTLPSEDMAPLAFTDGFPNSADETLDGCRRLLAAGASAKDGDESGCTPLFHAADRALKGEAANMAIELCQLLVDYGADVNSRNMASDNVLFHILRTAKPLPVDLVKILLNLGADVTSRTADGESLLHVLIQRCHLYQASDRLPNERELIAQFFADGLCNLVKSRDNQGNSVLHVWARGVDTRSPGLNANELTEIGRQLICKGAVVNARNDLDESPLHVASTWTTAYLLLENGAKVDRTDCQGRVPLLSWAASERPCHALMLESWRPILETGMDPWVADSQDCSLLEALLRRGKFKQARGLVGAVREMRRKDINKQVNSTGDTFLHIACQYMADDTQTLVNLLLECGANPNIPNTRNDTPLHIACRNVVQTFESQSRGEALTSVHIWVVDRLLRHQAEPLRINEKGVSCIDIARDFPDLQHLLEKPVPQFSQTPSLLEWKPQSEKHKPKLAQVSRSQQSVTVDCYSYHIKPIGSGAFGYVYAGIDETDGREVAIKRIVRQRIGRPEDQREVDNLVKLKDCEQVVKYLRRVEDKQQHFVYLILELMEGNLEEYMETSFKDPQAFPRLCQDVVLGVNYLHHCEMKHRDIKPRNILYKTVPLVCLKLADFGLSTKATFSAALATSVMHTNAGTRCWMAPELLREGSSREHSNKSDTFACGLVLHFILANMKHPFAPLDDSEMSQIMIQNATERNISNNVFSIDCALPAEGQHLVELMIQFDDNKRPDTDAVLKHPFFWSKQKKMHFLGAVGNQHEIADSRSTAPLSLVKQDLEASFGAQFAVRQWDTFFPDIYRQMTTYVRRRKYVTSSAVELVRFIRNCHAHVSDPSNTSRMKKAVLEDLVFLNAFPTLLMDVYRAVLKHGWDHREEIKYTLEIQ